MGDGPAMLVLQGAHELTRGATAAIIHRLRELLRALLACLSDRLRGLIPEPLCGIAVECDDQPPDEVTECHLSSHQPAIRRCVARHSFASSCFAQAASPAPCLRSESRARARPSNCSRTLKCP